MSWIAGGLHGGFLNNHNKHSYVIASKFACGCCLQTLQTTSKSHFLLSLTSKFVYLFRKSFWLHKTRGVVKGGQGSCQEVRFYCLPWRQLTSEHSSWFLRPLCCCILSLCAETKTNRKAMITSEGSMIWKLFSLFNKGTIKVFISCSWRCPGTSATSIILTLNTLSLTVRLFF